jgi:NitT/TauT family transport system substrate-binding protein
MPGKCAAILLSSLLWAGPGAAETLKVAVPQRGSWETAPPDLGEKQGIFRKHGLTIESLYTAGAGETLQCVVSASCDIGLSAGPYSVLGAYAKGAPLRIIAPMSTGSTDLFWYVRADSPIKSMREANGATIAYSTAGASTQTIVLRFIDEYGLKAQPVATGTPPSTFTQVMSRQVDVGWAIAPFQFDALDKGEVRIIARASDLAAFRDQTARVQIANVGLLAPGKDVLDRYMKAYRETLDWMYSSPDAIKMYLEYSKFSDDAVKRLLKDFITKETLQTTTIVGIDAIMKDAIQFKFLAAPLTEPQLSELIRVPPVAP